MPKLPKSPKRQKTESELAHEELRRRGMTDAEIDLLLAQKKKQDATKAGKTARH